MKKKEVSKSKLIAGKDYPKSLFQVELPKLDYENEGNFQKRKDISKPIVEEIMEELRERIRRADIEDIVVDVLKEYGFKKPKPKKRLKWRNPFYRV